MNITRGGGLSVYKTSPFKYCINFIFSLPNKGCQDFFRYFATQLILQELSQAPSLTESTAKYKDLKLYLFLSALTYTMYQIINLLVV